MVSHSRTRQRRSSQSPIWTSMVIAICVSVVQPTLRTKWSWHVVMVHGGTLICTKQRFNGLRWNEQLSVASEGISFTHSMPIMASFCIVRRYVHKDIILHSFVLNLYRDWYTFPVLTSGKRLLYVPEMSTSKSTWRLAWVAWFVIKQSNQITTAQFCRQIKPV